MTPSTDEFALSRPGILVGFLDLLVDAEYSPIDARSPGLILFFELGKRVSKLHRTEMYVEGKR
jgi:hypothetical protein